MEPSPKMIGIGIDGGTFKIIDYLTARGRLPTMRKMMDGGVKASLISTIQPISHTAWVSLYTGKNAGKHGIFDAVRRRKGSYELEPINGGFVEHEPLWSAFSRHGKRVCVFNVPVTYPPRPVNGFMVSGMDSPGIESTFTYPETLKGEILRAFPRYTIDLPMDAFVASHHPEPLRHMVEKIYESLEIQIGVIDYLLGREDWDFFFGIITVTDRLQHLLWPYVERKFDGAEITDDEEQLVEGVFGAYERIDEALSYLLEQYGSARRVMILSDHGFGPLIKDVHLNNFLADQGFLSFSPRSVWERSATHLFTAAKKHLPGEVKQYLKKKFPNRLPYFGKLAQQVDWDKTKIYSLGFFGNLCVNLRGREPLGIVGPGSQYESVIEDVISKLYELRDPDDGERVVDRAYRKEELYHGEALDALPDIFLVMRNYAYMALNQFFEIEPSSVLFGKPFREMGKLSHTGSHRLEGILIFHGEDFIAGKETETSILDVAPTILHASGLPILKGYDGNVRSDFFAPSWREKRSIDCELHEYRWGGEFGYSEDEERDVTERLKGLGYL
jgi:predicted AlkP superfamily phosphohydrolase/phosphomutase